MDDGKKKILRALAPVALVLTGFVIYFNSLDVPGLFDDYTSIFWNSDIHNLRSFLWYRTRYLTDLTFALNYAAGGSSTAGYHIVNIAIHSLNSVLLYFLVRVTFRTPLLRESGAKASPAAIGFAAALLFLTHPVQTQAVTYICQRYASFAATMYVLSLLLYVQYRLKDEGKWGGRAFYVLALASTALAQLTKELAFTLPFTIALYEFMFFRGRAARRILPLLPFILCMAIVPLGRLQTITEMQDFVGEGVLEITAETKALSRHDYLLTQFRVLVTYLRLLVMPVGQNLDYDYKVFTSVTDPQVLASFVALFAIAASSVYVFIRSRRSGDPYGMLAAFGVFWFFITISIESSIVPIADVIFEHRLYLPSIGAAIFFSSGLFYLSGRTGAGARAAWAAVLIAALALSTATVMRNRVWKSELALWMDVVSKSPAKARGYANVGYVLVKSGRPAEALPYLEKAIKLDPTYWRAYNSLGFALALTGDPLGGMKYIQEAIRLEPRYLEARNNMGYILMQMGRNDEALGVFRDVLARQPDYSQCRYNMGTALMQLGRYDEALDAFSTVLKERPDFLDAYVNMANTLVRMGRLDDAIEAYRAALSMRPDYNIARANLEVVLRKKAQQRP